MGKKILVDEDLLYTLILHFENDMCLMKGLLKIEEDQIATIKKALDKGKK